MVINVFNKQWLLTGVPDNAINDKLTGINGELFPAIVRFKWSFIWTLMENKKHLYTEKYDIEDYTETATRQHPLWRTTH